MNTKTPSTDNDMTGRRLAFPVGLVVMLGGLTAFGALSIDMYLPAFPSIGREFAASPGAVERSLATFLAGMAIGQLIYGPLSDRIGRRSPLIGGIALYIVASLLCMASVSVNMLAACRFLQGFGACAAMVVSRAIVRDVFDHQDSARVFSMIVLVFGLAPVLAPLIGSYVLTLAGWHAIFGVLAAFGAVMLFVALFRFRETRPAAAAELARSEHPLAALRLLAGNRQLLGYMLTSACNSACLFTYISATPVLFMDTYGVSPVTFGWLFALNAVGFVGGSQVNRLLLEHYAADSILGAACMAAAVLGVLLLAVGVLGIGGLTALMVMLFGVLVSYGFVMGNASAGALSVDPLRSGSISALLGVSGFTIGGLTMTLASLFADGSAVPMAAVMCGALLIAALSYHWLIRRRA